MTEYNQEEFQVFQPTRLQQDLAERIVQLVNEDGLASGTCSTRTGWPAALNVSRTPVRGALHYLEDQGVVARRPNRGVELLAIPSQRARHVGP